MKDILGKISFESLKKKHLFFEQAEGHVLTCLMNREEGHEVT